jgi:hypothetical protein
MVGRTELELSPYTDTHLHHINDEEVTCYLIVVYGDARW